MPLHLFILASHNTGSTALWRLLGTSPAATCLPVEGQHIEEVSTLMRVAPWKRSAEIPWDLVRAGWEPYWNPDRPIRIEKSPPNLLRARAIEAAFEDARFIVMLRDPYAYCEGVRRRGRNGINHSTTAGYREIAQSWITEAYIQKENLEQLSQVIYLSYESLTDEPEKSAARILDFLPELVRLNTGAAHRIHSLHGYVMRPVTNLNPNQIALLSAADISEINAVLSGHPEILAFFGYSLLDGPLGAKTVRRLFWDNLVTRYFHRNLQRIRRRLRPRPGRRA